MKICLALLLGGILAQASMMAHAHDIATAKSPEEARVFQFYATWMRPPERSMSCCNMQDCHTVQVKRTGGEWYFLDAIDQQPPAWRQIPPGRLEQNVSDPRESPDGESHVCFNRMYVLCAVLGSGQ